METFRAIHELATHGAVIRASRIASEGKLARSTEAGYILPA